MRASAHIAHVQNVGTNGTPVLTMLPSPTVRIVICGNADGGDDGVALSAAATVLPSLPSQVGSCLEVRRRQQLRVDDLIDLRRDERCLIIDAVSGITPGDVVIMSLEELATTHLFVPRSSHELPIELVLGLTAIIREQSIDGTFVGLGGHRWGYGTPISRCARTGMSAFRAAIVEQLALLTGVQSGVPAGDKVGITAGDKAGVSG